MSTPNRDEETGNAGQNAQIPQRSSVPSFLFLSFLLFMLTSHNGDEFLARHQHQDALKALTWQLSNYTSWMNGTESNFTIPDREPALGPLLDAFNVQGKELNPIQSSYYLNITGFIHGDSQFHNVSSLNDTLPWKPLAEEYMTGFNLTQASERWGVWNWNISSKAALSVVEKKPLGMDEKVISDSNLALVHGRVELNDEVSGEDLRFDFEGVHFLSNGSIYGFAEPPGGRIDIRLLPSLVPESARNATAAIIAPELKARITKLKNLIDAGVLEMDSVSDETPKTTCSFTFFGHINPASVPQFLMQELEDEIQSPTGISTVSPPKLSMEGVLISKECGILYTFSKTEGLRSRTFFRKVTTYAGFSALGYLMILILFARQLERSRNPSGISRVSRWTFLSQATMDSVSFAGHITFAIIAEGRPSMSLIAPAFLACILFVQEAQFFALINQVQGSERAYNPPPPPRQTSLSPAARSSDGFPRSTPLEVRSAGTPPRSANSPTTSSPLAGRQSPPSTSPSPPAAARPTPTPQFPPTQPGFYGFLRFFIHHIQTDPQAQLWVGLFIFLAIIVQVILSPTLSVLFVATTYSSVWLPQIVRSARKNRESGLAKEYIVGTSLCRLFSAMYFLTCPKNVLDVDPRPWAPLLAFFMTFQAGVLMLQDIIGPSFFLPDRFKASQGYDYHPPMPLPDSESPEQSLGDCAICMDAILIDPSLRPSSTRKSMEGGDEEKRALVEGELGETSGLRRTRNGILSSKARKNYSLAPCHHLFHTECLEKWLGIKNICPQCRRPLPPL